MKLWLRRNLMLVIFVIAPNCATIVYYGLIASKVYVSESRFLVRSPQHSIPTSGIVGELLQGTGISHSQDDTYAVRDFILSRDALKELQATIDVRRIYARSEADIIDRFPGLDWDSSFEELYKYYEKRLTVEYDPVTSITTLTVRAFAAEDAQKINSQLLDMSERLVNTLNDRSRQDMVRFADNEVRIASDNAKEASVALLSYRSAQSVFEPDKQAAIQLENVAKIQMDLVSTEADLAQIKRLSPDNPQIGALTSRAETLRETIAAEANKVTNARSSFSARAPNFERLALEVEFADKRLGLALAELESAKADAQQQQLYLERLVQPSLPDKAMEPKRLRSIFAILLMSIVVWGVASIVRASVREHTE
jgi:capsular polysaccharide transport system permease protein